MSDKDKKGKDDPKPLKDVKVDVHAEPKDRYNNRDRHAAKKVEETVKKEVHEAIKKKASKGAEEQFKEADREVDRAKDSINPGTIKKLRVKISGKKANGDDVVRQLTVTPKEDKPEKDE